MVHGDGAGRLGKVDKGGKVEGLAGKAVRNVGRQVFSPLAEGQYGKGKICQCGLGLCLLFGCYCFHPNRKSQAALGSTVNGACRGKADFRGL